MPKNEGLISVEEMSLLHQNLLKSADARAQLPSVDLDRIARLAGEAYRKSSLDTNADKLGMAHVACADIATMKLKQQVALRLAQYSVNSPSNAIATVELIERDELRLLAQQSENSRTGWFTGVISGVIAILLVAAIYQTGLRVGESGAKIVLGISMCVFTFLVVLTASRVFARSPSWFATLIDQHKIIMRLSSGSIAASLLVVLFGGVVAIKVIDTQSDQKLDASIRQLSQALAWAIAAERSGADREKISQVVARATEVHWDAADRPIPGMLLASVELSQGNAHAEVRLSQDQSAVLAAVVRLRNGEAKYADYLAGNVVASDLKSITISPSSGVKRTIALPRGEPAPPVHSFVLIALNKDKNEATSIRSIDTAIASIKNW